MSVLHNELIWKEKSREQDRRGANTIQTEKRTRCERLLHNEAADDMELRAHRGYSCALIDKNSLLTGQKGQPLDGKQGLWQRGVANVS